MTIDALTLQQLKEIRKELGMKEEKSLAEETIDENYFFMKDNRRAVLSTQLTTKRNLSTFLDYLSCQPTRSLQDFSDSIAEVTYHINGSKDSTILVRDILYFYNEAIPMEYEKQIFSYKRNHKKATTIDQAVIHRMYNLADKLKIKKEAQVHPKK